MRRKKSMIIGCNIWMICLKLNWFLCDPSWMLQLSEFVWMISSSVWVVFNNFLLIDATDRCNFSSNHHLIFRTLHLKKNIFYLNHSIHKIIHQIMLLLVSKDLSKSSGYGLYFSFSMFWKEGPKLSKWLNTKVGQTRNWIRTFYVPSNLE